MNSDTILFTVPASIRAIAKFSSGAFKILGAQQMAKFCPVILLSLEFAIIFTHNPISADKMT